MRVWPSSVAACGPTPTSWPRPPSGGGGLAMSAASRARCMSSSCLLMASASCGSTVSWDASPLATWARSPASRSDSSLYSFSVLMRFSSGCTAGRWWIGSDDEDRLGVVDGRAAGAVRPPQDQMADAGPAGVEPDLPDPAALVGRPGVRAELVAGVVPELDLVP